MVVGSAGEGEDQPAGGMAINPIMRPYREDEGRVLAAALDLTRSITDHTNTVDLPVTVIPKGCCLSHNAKQTYLPQTSRGRAGGD
jgi:hypothetical protein